MNTDAPWPTSAEQMVAWPDAEQADDLGLQADKLTRQRLGRRAAAPLLERLERALLVEPLIPSNR